MKDYQNRFPYKQMARPAAKAGMFLLTFAALAAFSQNQPGPQETAKEAIRVNVNVVTVLFNVKDKRGALIPGLKKEDFELYEDNVGQTIKYFATENDLPLTLGILVDTSGSQEQVLGMEKEAGAEFLKDVLRPKDLAFLVDFSVDVQLDQDFTNSQKYLKQALDQLRINTGGHSVSLPPGAGGDPIPISNPKGTLLFDAVYLAANEKLKREVGRKALILLTDGQDYGSRIKPKGAIEAALKSDAIVYVILIADRGFYGIGGYFGESDMKKLTQETGGRVIEVGNDFRKLKEAFDQISEELRHQYYVGYTPTNNEPDGNYRKIDIKVKESTLKDAKIQARRGYYAPRR